MRLKTGDSVPIILCQDCKYFQRMPSSCWNGWCLLRNRETDHDEYCSRAKLEDDKNAVTDKQLKVIAYIESNLKDVMFSGKTKHEASDFIKENIERSRAAYSKSQTAYRREQIHDYYRSNSSVSTANQNDAEARYEKYIEDASDYYAYDGPDDGFGGFYGREKAREACSFDYWSRWIDTGN